MSNKAGTPIEFKLDHVSLTVADLEAVIDFYGRVFGARVLYRMGPFDAAEIPPMEDGSDWTIAHVNVGAARLAIAMIELTPGYKVELFQYDKPADARRDPPRNCDVGASHFCLQVNDIDAAVARLEDEGCRVLAGPITMTEAPCPDSHSWYVLDPFGHQLELVQYL
ncbi:VOC family protein [Kineobactrum salinum]|uniref:VOC family protein n=1 Tax=Kineobactrum salinum TaxID=2708301 RepID=UPI001E59F70C|nr:VOC family protein [Kineobactrum salinum]